MKVWLVLSILPLLGLGASNTNNNNNAMIKDEMATTLSTFSKDVASHNLKNLKRASSSNNNKNAKKTLIRRTFTSTPYSETVITWGAGSKSCATAATTVTISCASGGKIAIGPDQSGVAKCTTVSANTLKCTKQPSASGSAYVAVTCSGKYSVTASVPKYTFTNCKRSVRGNVAYQLVNLAQVCAVKAKADNYTGVYSKICTPASELYVDKSTGIPACSYQSYKCTNTSKTTCAIAANAVTIASPVNVNSLCIIP